LGQVPDADFYGEGGVLSIFETKMVFLNDYRLVGESPYQGISFKAMIPIHLNK
jgi:hypothetical protein